MGSSAPGAHPKANTVDIYFSSSYSLSYVDPSEQRQQPDRCRKYELLDAIWEDLEAHASQLSREQAEELDRHIATYEDNPPVGTPWEQVKAGLPKR